MDAGLRPRVSHHWRAGLRTVHVRDLTATAGPRTHEVAIGHLVTFRPGKYEPLSWEQARGLVGNDGFDVRETPDGSPIRPVEHEGDFGRVQIRTDQVIATFEELTAAALVSRCEEFEAGRKFHARSSREKMIDFLMRQRLGGGAEDTEGEDDAEVIADDSPDLTSIP